MNGINHLHTKLQNVDVTNRPKKKDWDTNNKKKKLRRKD